MEMKAKRFIVIEGVDGAGKTTQAKKLVEYFANKGEKAVYLKFPNYESLTGQLIRKHSDGLLGDASAGLDKNPYGSSLFFTLDRYLNTIGNGGYRQYFENPEMTIVADRYHISNLMHQGAKFINSSEGTLLYTDEKYKLIEYMKFITNLEKYMCGIPFPDDKDIIYLNLPISECINRVNLRGTHKDIYDEEANLKKVCRAGEYYAGICGWNNIKINELGDQSEDGVHTAILKALNLE